MKKYEKEVQQAFLNNEEAVIKQLKTVYDDSLDAINGKVAKLDMSISQLQKALADVGEDEIGDLAAAVLKKRGNITPAEAKETLRSMIQSKVYQKNYQTALKKQVGDILDKMHESEFKTVSDYLVECYDNGFIGAMYSMQQQGIPLCMPIDQTAVVRAVQLDSKISKGLYTRLGEDVALLKKKIAAEVSRGISTGMSYKQVAQQLAGNTSIGFNNAVRIARTEGHRVQTQSAMNAAYSAKEKGADVLKQWDAALDARTRDSHAKVDGEIRELDKPFSNGLMFPGDPSGGAAEVINCRCALLQRARWALDEDELQTLKDRAAYYGLDKTESFSEYKERYLTATAKTDFIWGEAVSDTEKAVLNEIRGYYDKVSAKYGVKMDILGDKLADSQADWDMALKWNVQEYMREHPKVSKKQAESIVKKTKMAARPVKEDISILEGGQYWHDATRIVESNGAYNFKHIKKIIVNQNASDFAMTIQESEEKIRERFAKIERRRAKGRTTRLYLSNATEGGAGTFLHEYGHAIDFTNGIAENPKFREWYDTLTEDDICKGLSSYAATNPNEFIAEAFAESFFSYQRPMSKKFMNILDDILKGGITDD